MVRNNQIWSGNHNNYNIAASYISMKMFCSSFRTYDQIGTLNSICTQDLSSLLKHLLKSCEYFYSQQSGYNIYFKS